MRDDVRSRIRIQTLAIGAGFSATLFILSIQLHVELPGERLPFYYLPVMACLFLLGAILNFLQLLIYDILESPHWRKAPFVESFTEALWRKIKSYRFWAWHCLIAPSLLALVLLDVWVMIAGNLIYGGFLYHYYFLPKKWIDRNLGAGPAATPAA